MYKLSGHSLTRGKWFLPESQGVTIQERDGSCSLTLGPEAPEIGFDDWLLDEYDGSVWRVKSMDDTPSNDTRSIEAEPVIKTLDGISITGGDVNPAVITGDSSAISCSARTALRYLLGLQSDWQLGDVAFEHSDYYEFSEGDTIYDAIESVTSTLEDSVWVTDTSSYPFTLHIRKLGNAAQCEMRGGRNLSTLRKSINRSGMYTRIYPVGQNDLRLPEGYLAKNENKYGRIDHHETDQSRTTEDSLRSWAQARLNRHCEPEVSISITGLELSESTGEPLDRLTINTICRVPLHDWGRETILERIVKKQWPDRRKEPQKVNITLANTKADITSLFRQSSRSAGRAARGQAKQNYLFVANGENLMYEIFDESGHLHGLLRMTEESFRLAFDNLESSLRSELLLTAESLRLAFENDMDSLRSEIDMTAESLRISFENDVSSLRSEINLSAESLRIAFDNGMSSLRSEINVTAESLRISFESDVSSLRSEINVSAESLRIAFTSDVSSLRSEIQTQADRIGLVVTGSGPNASVSRAALILAINNGRSSATLKADTIDIDGLVESLEAKDVMVQHFNAAGGEFTEDLSVLQDLSVAGDTSLNTLNTVSLTIDGNDVLIYDAEVNGNTLTIWKTDGTSINFSKATALSGQWLSRVFTVVATQEGSPLPIGTISTGLYDGLVLIGEVSHTTLLTHHFVSADLGVYEDDNGSQGTLLLQKTMTLPADEVYQDGYNAGIAEGGSAAADAVRALIRTRFAANSGQYYIESYENSSGGPAISGTQIYYTLNVSAAAGSQLITVELLNSNGTRMNNTPNMTLTLAVDQTSASLMSGGTAIASVTHTQYADGQNAVTITKGAWSAGRIEFTKSAGTPSTKSVQLTTAAAVWDGNTASVVIWDGTGADASHGVQTGYTVNVDASGRYTAGETAGQNAVTINKGSWSGGRIEFTKSAGTPSTKSVQLVAAAASWNGNTATVAIWDGTSADASSGVSTGYTVTVDASGIYTAGQNSIQLIKSSWNAGVVAFRKSNTASGTRTVQLTAAAAVWDGNTASVAIWDGSAADSSHGVNTGYTVTVDASARYTAGETAGQNAVTITKGAWSGGKISFTKSAGTASTKSVQLTAAAATWNGNTASVVIWDGTAADSSHGVQTGYTVTVDASARYTAGEEAGMAAGTTAGQNTVTITKGAWSSGKISFTKSVGTASTKSVQLTAAAATWNGNTASVVIWDGTAADSSHGVNTGYTVTVDASTRYTAGETAGQNAVTINKGSWSGGKISFTKSVGTTSTKSVQLTAATPTWDGDTASVVIWDGTAASTSSGVSTGYTVTVDASARYNAGVTAGTTAGQNAVTINKGSWSGGRIEFTKSAGTPSTKSVQLVAAAASWNGNTASVVIWDGTAADSSHGVSTGYTVTLDASARYNAGVTAGTTAGQNAVTINKGSWSGGKISFTKSAGTASTKSVQLTAAAATWSDNTASVVIWDGTAADSSHGVSTGYTVTVNAAARYNAGYDAGWKAAGAASNPPSTTGTLSNHANFKWPKSSVSGGVNSRDYYVTIDSPTSSGSGSSIKYTIQAFIRQNGTSGSKVAKASLDITSVYNAGVAAGSASSSYTSRSNGAWGLTYFSATADHTVASKLYYLENGTYKSAGTYFWYHRSSYLQTQTVYTK